MFSKTAIFTSLRYKISSAIACTARDNSALIARSGYATAGTLKKILISNKFLIH